MSPPAILHVDMDAFFASVEMRDDPSLRGKPVLVGGRGRRGVVAAASYESRVFGCHSAMPMAVALRKCPQAIVVTPRFEAYQEASSQVFEVFDRFSPLVEALSIDEAFIDVTGTERLFGTPRQCGEAIRAAVFEQTKLTCSVGVASVKFVAKIASALKKPDGLTEVPPGTERDFLAPLPIGKLWGVGPKTEATLAQRGVEHIGDLRRFSEAALRDTFGEHGQHLWRLANAIDDRVVTPGWRRKTLSHEDTYAVDAVGRDALRGKLLSQATRVADRLVGKSLRGKLVRLKIRDTDFRTETRQRVLPEPTRQARAIYEAACSLLDKVDLDGRRFRLTGVGVGQLEPDDDPESPQLDLLARLEPQGATGEQDGEKLQDVLSAVRERFGHQALFPADASPDARPGSAGGFTTSIDPDSDR